MTEHLVLIVAELTPEESGRFAGAAFVFMLIIAGLIKCVQISKRETTSALCVSSLIFVLLAWLVGSTRTLFEETHMRTAIFAVTFTVLIVISVVLAIVGLLEYRKHSNIYIQGRAQAVWALLISCSLLAIMAVTAVQTIAKREANFQELVESDDAGATGGGGGSRRFDELNFRFEPNNPAWLSLSPKSINPVASLAYLRRNPDMWFAVIAEKIGVENEFDNNALATIAQTNLRAAATGVEIRDQRPEKVNGIDGIRFTAQGVIGGRSVSYSNWVCAHNGFAYQLTAWSLSADRNALRKAATKLCRGFNLIDDQRVSHAEGIDLLEEYRSPNWGYKLDFSQHPGWVRAPDEILEVPAADVIGLRTIEGHQVSVGVVPIDLPNPDVDAKDMLGIVLDNLFNFQNKAKMRRQIVPYKSLWLEGSEVTGVESSRQVNFAYRMRLLTDNDRAYLLAGWWPPECKSADEHIQEIFDTFDTFAPKSKTTALLGDRAKAVGLLHNDLGTVEYAAGKHERAVKYFEAALANYVDPTVISNLVNAYYDARQVSQADAALDKYLADFPDDLSLRSLKAALCQQLEEFDEALELYSKLFADGYADEADLQAYLTLAIEHEEYNDAISTLRQFNHKHGSSNSRRWLALMHARNGEYSTAIKQMRVLTEEDEQDEDALYTLGEIYELAGQHSEALTVSQQLLERNPDNVESYLLKGRNEFELEKYPAAQQSFEKLLETYPDNEEAKQYLQYLSALLGKGDRTQISKLVEPVPLPAEVEQMMREAENQPRGEGEAEFDAVDIYKVTGISYSKGGQCSTTTYLKFRVNTQAGVDSLSTLTKSFDPLTEQLHVNRLAVLDASGELIAEGSPEDYYVLDDSGASQASQDRRVYLPVPSLKSGYTVEMVITVEDIGDSDSFRFENQFLVAVNPLRLGAVFVRGDLTEIGSSSNQLAVQTVGSDLKIWSVKSPQVYKVESYQATLEHFLPYVHISGNGLSWEEIGREYLDRIKPKLAIDAKTEALAEELTKDLSTEQEKIATLAKYVQSECTYKALEFGVRSQVPNTARQVLKNGYGDCKDHSVLLMQLLNSAGVRSNLALINSDGPLTRDLPSMSQFDHMIVCIPANGKRRNDLFLDATEKYTTPMVPKSPGLENKWSLVLDAEKPYLKQTPGYGESAAEIRIKRVVSIERQAEAEVAGLAIQETIALNPYCSRGLRGYLQAYSSRNRRNAIRDLIAGVKKVRIKKLSVDNLEVPTKSLVMHLEYSIAKTFKAVGAGDLSERLIGEIPAIWEYYLLDVEFDDGRMTPFELTLPTSVVSKTELRLPVGYTLLNNEKLNRQNKSKFMRWQTIVTPGQGKFVFDSTVHRNTGLYEPEEFQQYWDSSQRALSAVGCSIKLSPEKSVSNLDFVR